MTCAVKFLGVLVLTAALVLPAPASATLVELMIVLSVKDSAGRTVQTVTTDRRGNFTLQLAPGTYRLTVTGDSLAKASGITKTGPGELALAIKLGPRPIPAPPTYEDRAAVRRDGVKLQDISFTRLLTIPASGAGGTGGGRYSYWGEVRVAVGDYDGDGR